MLKRIGPLMLAIFFLANMSGCVAILAGAAGGAGTATWLGGKLTQEVDASMTKSHQAVNSALRALKLDVEKETKKDDVIQVISKYTDGKTIWIDIRPITSAKSKIEVRVGAISDEEASRKVMDKILRYI